ncbi:MAG: hypothetical protein ACR2NU_05775, partial [Aeoliella sp.]
MKRLEQLLEQGGRMSATDKRSAEATSIVARYLTYFVALTGSLLLFAAQPPLGWSPLAWVAPIPWLWLATRPQLTGGRPYLQIWFASTVYWLLALHWIRLAHPWTWLGLVFLASYLAVHLPLFVGLTRLG